MASFTTLVPIEVTDAVLVSSTVPEDEHPAWVAGTYAQFDRVIHGHVIYEDGLGGVSNTPPSEEANRWNPVNPTNRWRIFDQNQLALTSQPTAARYIFKPGRAIQGLIAIEQEDVITMRVRLVDGDDLETGTVVYDRSTSTVPMPISNSYYHWFAGPLVQLSPTEIQSGFPSLANGTLIVDFEGGANMKFGPILFGDVREWGIGVKTGGAITPTDYSLNEPDAFGRIKYVPRGYSSGGTFELVLENRELDDMYRYFMQMRRKPAALIPSDRWTSTIFYGRFSFSVVIAYPEYSETSLTIKGLVKND